MKRFLHVIYTLLCLVLLAAPAWAQTYTFKNGETTTPIILPGSSCVYKWTNNTPGIGLASGGISNSIPAFKAVNTGTADITATISLSLPNPLADAHNYPAIYLVTRLTGKVWVIDPRTNIPYAAVPTGSDAFGITVNSDRTLAYVSNRGTNTVTVIRTVVTPPLPPAGPTLNFSKVTDIPVGAKPEGIVVSPDGSKVYVVNSDDASVSVINTADNTVSNTIPLGTLHPSGIAITPDGSKLFITNYASGSVSVITTADGKKADIIPVGNNPEGIAVSPDGSKVYVANQGSNTVSVIDAKTDAIIGSPITVGSQPFGLAISPDGTTVYTSNQGDNTVSAIKASNSQVTPINVGSKPQGISVTPDGTQVFVNNSDSEDISVINTAGYSVTKFDQDGVPFSFGNFIAQPAGCTIPPFEIKIVIQPTPPSISYTGSPSALTTPQGLVSASTNFSVSGLSLPQGMVVTPPDGFEVSLDDVNFSPTVTVGTGGNIDPTKVYIRLKKTGSPQTFQGDIVLSSGTVTPVHVPMPASTVTGPVPTIITSTATGTIYSCSGTPSTSPNLQQISVSAVYLNGALTASVLNGGHFEVSLSANGDFKPSIDIPDATDPVTVYVRSSAAAAGTEKGVIRFSSPGAATKEVAVFAIAFLVPTADTPTPASQTKINGQNSDLIHFKGTGSNTFNWTNNTAGIGLSGSGTGDILPFKVINNGTTDITATITVTPVSIPIAYTANFKTGQVTAVNIATNQVIATIPVGKGPKGLIVSRDATRLYVVNYISGDVTVINASDNSIVTTIPVGLQPQGVELNADGSILSVFNSADNTFTTINTETNKIIATKPVVKYPPGTVISPDGKKAYVYDYGALFNNYLVYDTSTDQLLKTLPGLTSPQGLTLNSDGSLIYMTNANENRLYTIDANTYEVKYKIDVGQFPQGISLSKDGKWLYVANSSSNTVSVIKTETNENIIDIDAGENPLSVGTTAGTGCEGVPVTCTITVKPTPPTITAKGEPANMTTIQGNASTPASSFIVSGIKMQDGILVTPPNGFEVSLDENGTYGSTVTIPLTRTDGIIADTKVYIRLAASTMAGTYSGDIIMSSKNAENEPLDMPESIVYLPTSTILAGGASGSINTCQGAPSASPNIMKFTASGFKLKENITVTAPTGFEVSFNPDGGYQQLITMVQSGGVVANTAIYVRSAASAMGNITGQVLLHTPGATDGRVNVKANVGVTPYVNKVSDQPPIIGGMNTLPINFSGSVNTYYNWTNNNTGIGLAQSGYGDIAAFTAINKGNTVQVANIKVTPRSAAFAYVAMFDNKRLSIINTATNTVVGSPINIGSSPTAVAASPDGKLVYIANQGENTISVINTNTNQEVLPRITGLQAPSAIVVSNDGSKIYVADNSASYVTMIDAISHAAKNIPVGLNPDGIALSPDGKTLYAVNGSSAFLSAINTTDMTPVKIPISGSGPKGIVISPDGTRIYITNYNGKSVTVIDVGSGSQVLPAIAVGNNPRGIAINNDGSKVYVANSGTASNSVSVIDTKTGSVINVPVGSNPQGVSITPDGSMVYVANSGSNSMSVISTATNLVVTTIDKLPGSPVSFGNFITGGAGCVGAEMTFKITVNPETAYMTTNGTLPPLYTTYGTASSAGTFDVTGISLTGPITITPPPGLEVSVDNSNANFKSPLTFTPAKDGQPTTIYVRLSTTAPAKTYTDKIDISSPGAANVPVSLTAVTKVDPAPLDLMANKVTKTVNTVLTGGPGSKAFTQKGLMNNESIGSVTITYGPGSELSAAIATYPGSVMVSDPVGGTFTAGNYTINPIGADLVVSNIVNADLIKIPNAFSPNGDGINDTWKIGDLLNFPTSTVDIFDRSGRSIFHSVGYPIPWDGTFAGKYLPYGTYYYLIDIDNGAKRLSGYVLLIR